MANWVVNPRNNLYVPVSCETRYKVHVDPFLGSHYNCVFLTLRYIHLSLKMLNAWPQPWNVAISTLMVSSDNRTGLWYNYVSRKPLLLKHILTLYLPGQDDDPHPRMGVVIHHYGWWQPSLFVLCTVIFVQILHKKQSIPLKLLMKFYITSINAMPM